MAFAQIDKVTSRCILVSGQINRAMSAFTGSRHQSLILITKVSIILCRGSLVNSHLALQTIAQRRRKSVLSEEKEIVLIETESGSVDFIIDNKITTLDFIRRYESGVEGDGQC